MNPDHLFLSLAHYLASAPQPHTISAWMAHTFTFANVAQESVPGWEAPFHALLDGYKARGLFTDADGIWSLTPHGLQLAASAVTITTTTVTTTTTCFLPHVPAQVAVTALPPRITPTEPVTQDKAPRLDESGLPRPLFFRGPLLQVIAKGGDAPVKIKHVATEVLRATGYDPSDKLLQARVRWAIQNMQVDPNNLLRSAGYGLIALTAKGLTESRLSSPVAAPDEDPAVNEEPALALIEEPIEEPVGEPLEEAPPAPVQAVVTRIAPQRPSQGNETAQWFSAHLQEGGPLMLKMRNVLRRRLPLSAQYDFIEDHIHNFVMRAISRNSLANLIAEGDVPYNKVVAYCVNSGMSDIRDSATKPVMREIFLARTARERAADHTPGMITVQPASILTSREEGLLDIPDHSTGDEIVRARMWRQIREAFGADPAVEVYCRVLKYKSEGMSNKEIARVEDIPTSKASAIFRRARKVLRRRITSEALLA
jgi:hypothetical protein